MSLWSRIRGVFTPKPSVPAPPPPGMPPGPRPPTPEPEGTPNQLLYKRFIEVPAEYERIKYRRDLVWEVWRQRRIEVLENFIVNQGKALKGHPAADFQDIVKWGIELEYLSPKINWRKDLNTP
jgi:hypothetical protein